MTSTSLSVEAVETAEFAGKTALVTGAARGIGKETVALLHARGAHVVALDLRPELASLAQEFPGVMTVAGDVTVEETASRAVESAVDAFGGLDILVNNAGRTLNKPVTHTTAEDWDSVMDVNARGAFFFAREAFRALAERGGGAIVSTGSYASAVGLPEGVAYSASKGALAQVTKVQALEGGPLGIRANLVAAGVVETDFLDTYVHLGFVQAVGEGIGRSAGLWRIGRRIAGDPAGASEGRRSALRIHRCRTRRY
ncbi:SDR family NAD(P)-dependent oxidoreductase [Streptomyces seoulensis]